VTSNNQHKVPVPHAVISSNNRACVGKQACTHARARARARAHTHTHTHTHTLENTINPLLLNNTWVGLEIYTVQMKTSYFQLRTVY